MEPFWQWDDSGPLDAGRCNTRGVGLRNAPMRNWAAHEIKDVLLLPACAVSEGLRLGQHFGCFLAVGAVWLLRQILLHPRSLGTVSLRSADPRDTPAIDFRYFEQGGEEDLDAVVDGVRFVRSLSTKLRKHGLIAEEETPGDECQTAVECSAADAGASAVCANDGECNEGSNERCLNGDFGEAHCVITEAPGDPPCADIDPALSDLVGVDVDGSSVHFCGDARFTCDNGVCNFHG